MTPAWGRPNRGIVLEDLAEVVLVLATEFVLQANGTHSLVSLREQLERLRMQVHFRIEEVEEGVLEILEAFEFEVLDLRDLRWHLSRHLDVLFESFEALGQEAERGHADVLDVRNRRKVVLVQLVELHYEALHARQVLARVDRLFRDVD